MLDIFVINLPRRADRRATFEQWNAQEGLAIQFVEAIDGRELQWNELVEKGVVAPEAQHFTAGDLGCACSHKMLWEKSIQENRPVLVCEDDAILCPNFAARVEQLMPQLASTWDFVLCGFNFDAFLDVEILPGIDLRSRFSRNQLEEHDLQSFAASPRNSLLLPLNNAFGLCAYLISPDGARKLREWCFPLKGLALAIPAGPQIIHPTGYLDAIMNIYYRRIEAYVAIPPLAVSPNDHDTSDARNPQRLT